MRSIGKHPLESKVEVDELHIRSPEKDKRGCNKDEKKLVVILVEKVKENKIERTYVKVIKQASADCFAPF